MLRVSPLYLSFRGGSRENERTIMGNIAIVVDLPDIDELEQVYRLDASEIKPEGMPSEDVPATPPGIEPEGMPSEDVPEGMPSEDQPAETPPEIQPEGMPSEDQPAGTPPEDQPAGTPPGIEPEGMPSELQNRVSVAEPPDRLPSRSPGQPTP
jgi:hypothetical protein